MIKSTINIAGKETIVPKVSCPATSSSSSPVSPAAAASALSLSIHLPIIGWKIDVENIPTAPIIDMPKAPLFGILSAMKPIMFGQK